MYFVKNEESDYRTENYNMENEIIIKNRKIRKFKKIKKVKFQLNNDENKGRSEDFLPENKNIEKININNKIKCGLNGKLILVDMTVCP